MITKAALLEDLDRAGIDPHGMLLCHFSMKRSAPWKTAPTRCWTL